MIARSNMPYPEKVGKKVVAEKGGSGDFIYGQFSAKKDNAAKKRRTKG